MTKFLVSAAALAAIVPAAALAEPVKGQFEHEGYSYVFTATEKGDSRIISGKRYPGAEAFRLVVADGRVRGTSAGKPVSFRLAEVERINDVKLASR